MTLKEIKTAKKAGLNVYWKSPIYPVIIDARGQYLIACTTTGKAIGLTYADEITLNAKEEDFYTTD